MFDEKSEPRVTARNEAGSASNGTTIELPFTRPVFSPLHEITEYSGDATVSLAQGSLQTGLTEAYNVSRRSGNHTCRHYYLAFQELLDAIALSKDYSLLSPQAVNEIVVRSSEGVDEALFVEHLVFKAAWFGLCGALIGSQIGGVVSANPPDSEITTSNAFVSVGREVLSSVERVVLPATHSWSSELASRWMRAAILHRILVGCLEAADDLPGEARGDANDLARRAYAQLAPLDPLRARVLKGLYSFVSGEHDRVRPNLERASSLIPRDQITLYTLCHLYLGKTQVMEQNSGAAIETFTHLLELQSRDPDCIDLQRAAYAALEYIFVEDGGCGRGDLEQLRSTHGRFALRPRSRLPVLHGICRPEWWPCSIPLE